MKVSRIQETAHTKKNLNFINAKDLYTIGKTSFEDMLRQDCAASVTVRCCVKYVRDGKSEGRGQLKKLPHLKMKYYSVFQKNCVFHNKKHTHLGPCDRDCKRCKQSTADQFLTMNHIENQEKRIFFVTHSRIRHMMIHIDSLKAYLRGRLI